MGKKSGRIRNIFRKKITKFIIVILALALVFAGLVKFSIIKLNAKVASSQVQLRTATVTRGNISVSLSGSGSIASANRVDVSPKVSGTVTKVYFKQKDTVKAGDVLFEIDDTDSKSKLEDARTNLAQAQINAGDTLTSIKNLVVRAPFSGTVRNITMKAGDDLNKGMTLMNITDSSKMKLIVPFNTSAINEIKSGMQAVLNLPDLMQSINGIVTYTGGRSYTSGSGGEVFDVEISFDNPGSLSEGVKANAVIETQSGTQTSTDNGKMTFVNSQAVKAATSGTVTKVNVRENTYVKEGDILAELQNSNLESTKMSNDSKLRSLMSQVDSVEKQLSDYKVTAPIDGVIVTQSVKVGDSVNPAQSALVITDMNNMNFSVSVDELDIEKVKIGQKVNITADAISETSTTPLTGEISDIALEGTSSSGVTTYPVTIKVNEAAKLKIGMNVNGEIMISEKTNVLRVPIEAVQKFGNFSFVMVRSNGQNTGNNFMQRGSGNTNSQNAQQSAGSRRNSNNTGWQGSTNNSGQSGRTNNPMSRFLSRMSPANAAYYANAVPQPVQLGSNNDTYIEIVSGLNEGDEVILPPLAASSSSSQSNTQSGFGGLGGGMGFPTGGFGGNGGQFNRNQGGNTGSSGTRSSGSGNSGSSGTRSSGSGNNGSGGGGNNSGNTGGGNNNFRPND